MDIISQMFGHICSGGFFKSTYVGKRERGEIDFLVFQLIRKRKRLEMLGSPDRLEYSLFVAG